MPVRSGRSTAARGAITLEVDRRPPERIAAGFSSFPRRIADNTTAAVARRTRPPRVLRVFSKSEGAGRRPVRGSGRRCPRRPSQTGGVDAAGINLPRTPPTRAWPVLRKANPEILRAIPAWRSWRTFGFRCEAHVTSRQEKHVEHFRPTNAVVDVPPHDCIRSSAW